MQHGDDFLKPSLSPATLDNYGIRKAILKALSGQLSRLSGVLLDIGCGDMPYKELLTASPSRVRSYIGMDLPTDHYRKPDISWDGRVMPLAAEAVDWAVATEVFEHCPDPQAI